MYDQLRASLMEGIADFSLPEYREIPDVGLFLEQIVKYVNGYLERLNGIAITSSMVSNYVKKGILQGPVKKQYGREQIAYLIFIAISKPVLSLDQIRLFIDIQQRTYAPDKAYDYFRLELDNVLDYVFGKKERMDNIGSDNTYEKLMLRNTIITAAHKIYLDRFFSQVRNLLDEREGADG